MTNQSKDLTLASDNIMERTWDPVNNAEDLRQRLSRDPVRIEQDSFSKANHVPVSVLEWTMDWVFGPLCWAITSTEIQDKGPIGKTSGGDTRIGFVAIVRVEAVHPFNGFVTKQTGVSSGDYTLGKFKMAFAAQQTLAFKNACKKWGKVFGRDLNRGIQEAMSGHLNKKDLILKWESEGISTIPELHNALKDAKKKYGAKLDLNKISEEYKSKHINVK